MSLHYTLSVIKGPKVTIPISKGESSEAEESTSGPDKSPMLWADMARWFGEDIRSIIDNIKGVPFQDVEEIRLRVGQPLHGTNRRSGSIFKPRWRSNESEEGLFRHAGRPSLCVRTNDP